MEVSVVICTYNGGQFITEQLNSIINQTYPLKEILIFDDNSTDNTFEIVQNFQSKYSNIKAFRNKQNLGFNKNFEQALKSASSEVIAISDQDDVWVNTKIEKLIAAWRNDVPLIYCRSVHFTNQLPSDATIDHNTNSFEGIDGRKLSYYNTISGHAILFRKSFLFKALPFNEGIMYDWWLGVVAAYNGGVQHLPEILVYQRVHSANITVTQNEISKKEKIHRHNQQALTHNEVFSRIIDIPVDHRLFFETFAATLQNSKPGTFNKPLFRFLIKNRRVIFYYKKSFNFISYLKHSYKIAKY